ncbi:MAG: thermonuclease family protein [Candidatus Falkowbacteria bacterium]
MHISPLFLVIFLFLFTACTQPQPQTGSGSPFINAYKKTEDIRQTAEEHKDAVDQILNEETIKEEAGDQASEPAVVENKTEPALADTAEESEAPVYYPVVKVVDGDTIDVNIDGKTERIRFIGLNTPETVDPRKPVECFGKEASIRAGELLSGQEVRLKTDPTQGDRDKYDRLLRYVYLKDGTDIALKLISDGYGYEYAYDLPYKNQDQYNKAEADARENERGLWAPGVCIEKTEEPEPAAAPTAPVAGSGEFTITNIFYDGVEGRTEPDEYVEIKNTGGPANLKGYTLSDESGKTFTFPDFTLAGGQSVKVFTGCGTDTASALYWCFTSSAIWNNSGDTATLKAPGGGVGDSYSY